MAKIKRICETCNIEFYRWPSDIKKVNHARFCSRSCRPSWNKGNKGFLAGKKSPHWVGNNIGYRGIHHWIKKQLGSADHCSFDSSHKSTRYHWANISGSYLRDVEDWTQLCPTCHRTYDKLTNKSASPIFISKNSQYTERRIFL